MPKKTLLIVLLILILTGGIATTSLYIGKKLAQPQEESFTPPSIEPEEITLEITPTEPSGIDISDWKTYRNDKYRFEMKYPSHLQNQKTLLNQPFNPGLEGSIIAFFSDGRTDELVLAVSNSSLHRYVVRDNPGGVSYYFDQGENLWISSVRGEITGNEPKLMDVPIIAYDYRSGDGICLWHGAVVPHPKEETVFDIVYVSCVDEGQQPGPLGRVPDLTRIFSTFRFTEK